MISCGDWPLNQDFAVHAKTSLKNYVFFILNRIGDDACPYPSPKEEEAQLKKYTSKGEPLTGNNKAQPRLLSGEQGLCMEVL